MNPLVLKKEVSISLKADTLKKVRIAITRGKVIIWTLMVVVINRQKRKRN